MKINIWSDVRCPFCYIAKKKFDEALSQFEHKDEVEVTWKSYELDPELKTDPSISTLEYLASNKRMPTEQVKQIFSQAKQMGKEVGIEMNMEESIPANSKNSPIGLSIPFNNSRHILLLITITLATSSSSL